MADRAEFAVDQWRRERPDLDALPMRLVGRLGEMAQVLNRDVLQPFFDEHRLHYGEFDVLATLRRAGEPYALSPTVLYESAMISSGGMTNRLDRLERAGLIERRKNPEDRRSTLVALTADGFALIDGLMAAHVDNERRALATLSEAEQRQLDALLGKWLAGRAPS